VEQAAGTEAGKMEQAAGIEAGKTSWRLVGAE